MRKLLVSLDEHGGGARLYIGNFTTVDALNLLDPAAAIAINYFCGYVQYGEGEVFCLKDDIPSLATVGEAALFLDQEEVVTLIDFEATLNSGLSVSTHDNCEATFRVSSKIRALELLDAALGSSASAVRRKAVSDHPGQYVLIEDGGVTVFATFDLAIVRGAGWD